MVDINKLKSRMVLAGYGQKSLTIACQEKGYKIGKNTLNSKFNGRSKWTCDDADMLCDVLGIDSPTERGEIFLA